MGVSHTPRRSHNPDMVKPRVSREPWNGFFPNTRFTKEQLERKPCFPLCVPNINSSSSFFVFKPEKGFQIVLKHWKNCEQRNQKDLFTGFYIVLINWALTHNSVLLQWNYPGCWLIAIKHVLTAGRGNKTRDPYFRYVANKMIGISRNSS